MVERLHARRHFGGRGRGSGAAALRAAAAGRFAVMRVSSLLGDTTRISDSISDGSALIRLISAAPRGVDANSRSSAITAGLRLVIVSSAFNASTSAKVRISFWLSASAARSFRTPSRLGEAIRTMHASDTSESILGRA